MPHRLLKPLGSRVAWLILGVGIGGGLAWAWPSQHAVAFTSDRNFSSVTVSEFRSP